MVGHFLNKTGREIEITMTWPDLQALIEHWKYEPPVPWLLARYFEIDERDAIAPEMSTEEAFTQFKMMGAAMSAAGKVYEQ